MIRSYKDKDTERFAKGEFIKAFDAFSDQLRKRLAFLDAAQSLSDLRTVRSNRLEALKGEREGQYSIRINKQWRICFAWPADASGPENVEVVDYH